MNLTSNIESKKVRPKKKEYIQYDASYIKYNGNITSTVASQETGVRQ